MKEKLKKVIKDNAVPISFVLGAVGGGLISGRLSYKLGCKETAEQMVESLKTLYDEDIIEWYHIGIGKALDWSEVVEMMLERAQHGV